jgi:glycosyltransferase involved in cell wall biosynthesis
MNILFLTQVLPFPLDAGPKVRIYYVLRYLSQHHRVTLVSFVRGEHDERFIQPLREFCQEIHTVPIHRSRRQDAWHLARSFINGQPFLIARDELAPMHAKIKSLVQTQAFDWIHADQLAMAQYATRAQGVKKVLDQHNAVWTIVQRMAQNEHNVAAKFLQALEWRKLQKYEKRIMQAFDHIVTVTEEDRQALSLKSKVHNPMFNPPSPIDVIPICIDPDEIARVERTPIPQHIICIGGMFYPPNVDGVVWFARDIFPRIQKECPNTKFFVVGARPDKKILGVAKDNSNIVVTGYVEDPLRYLRDSAVFIVPLRAGGGMRVKILDAWARGIPVVSTTVGAEGIDVRPGEDLLIGDTAETLAKAVTWIIRDPVRGQVLADNGRRAVETRYNWRTVYQQFDAIYGSAPN